MTFTSLQFFCFIPIVIAFYFLVPQRFRWIILLVSSYYFYFTWKFIYIFILILVTVISYFIAFIISGTNDKSKRKLVLSVGLIIFTGILFTFKYLNFFNSNLAEILNLFHFSVSFPALNLMMPVGISFFTFQILSYLLDIYNDKIKPVKHFGDYAVSIAYFPKLISGPIERSGNFIPQLQVKNEIEYDRIISGIKLMIWGLFKKVVIADRLFLSVNQVFDHPENAHGATVVFAVFLLSIQIYTDFSGYTDIAIGLSRILGINLTDNFNRPYLSGSIVEFWRRWHITLSNWLRDYIFLPVAYSSTRRIMKSGMKIKPENYSYIFSISVTMIICGIWHGAKWSFVIWGALHGLYLVIGFILKKPRKKFYRKINLNKTLQKYSGIIFTFILVSFAWIFFKANSLSDSFLLLKNIFTVNDSVDTAALFKNAADLYVALAAVLFLLTVEIIQTVNENIKKDFSVIKILNLPVIILILISIFLFGKFEQIDFLYFNF